MARSTGLLRRWKPGAPAWPGSCPTWRARRCSGRPGSTSLTGGGGGGRFDVLSHSIGQQVHIVSPLDVARRAREGKLEPPPAWMTRRIGG